MLRRYRPIFGFLVLVLLVGCGGEQPSSAATPEERNLVTACIRSAACEVMAYPTVKACAGYYRDVLLGLGLGPVYDQIYICTNRAKTCSEIAACFGRGEACQKDSFTAQCKEGKATSCDLNDHRVFTYDCPSSGLQCQIDSGYTFAASCVGGAARPSTLISSLDCGDGRCEKTQQSCGEDDLNRCQAEKLQVCMDRAWVTVDCARLGLGPCRDQSLGWSRCSDPAAPGL